MTTSLHYRTLFNAILSMLLLTFLSSPAYAHITMTDSNGVIHGLSHPFSGLDHLCAMIAIGLWSKQIGGRALWLLPLAFVSVMTLGGLFGMDGFHLPFAETGILLSLLVLGGLIATATSLPLFASFTLVALFALFHGYAHGIEMPHDTAGFGYASGMILSTALLHVTGIGMATLLGKFNRPQEIRLSGAMIALLGGALFFAG